MGGFNQQTGIVINISGDPKQAQAAVDQVRAAALGLGDVVKNVSVVQGEAAAKAREEVKAWGDAYGLTQTQVAKTMDAVSAAAAVETSDLGKLQQMGRDQMQVWHETEAAAQGAARGTSMWHEMNQGVIGDMRLLRYSMYALTTPLMFAYVIPQIESVYEGIKNVSLAVGGLGAAEQKAFEQAAQAYDRLMAKLHGVEYLKAVQHGMVAQVEQAEAWERTAQKMVDTYAGQLAPAAVMAGNAWSVELIRARNALDIANAKLITYSAATATAAAKDKEAAKGARDHAEAIDSVELATERYLHEALLKEMAAMDRKIAADQRWKAESAEMLQAIFNRTSAWNQEEAAIEKAGRAQQKMLDSVLATGGQSALSRVVPQLPALNRAVLGISTPLDKAGQAVDRLAGIYGVLATVGGRVYEQLSRESIMYGNVAVSQHQRVIAATLAEVAAMAIAAVTGQQAFRMMLRNLAEYLEKKAELKMAVQIAEALASLADRDFVAAELHFASAAKWGILAGAAAFAASEIGYGSTLGQSGQAAAISAAGSSTGSAAALGTQQQSQRTVIQFEGVDPSKIFTGQQLLNLIQGINTALANGTAKIIIRQPVVSRS